MENESILYFAVGQQGLPYIRRTFH